MVNTRSQTAKNISVETGRVDRYSDTESEGSIPEVLENQVSREPIIEFKNENLINNRNNLEMNTFDQQFCEMKRRISDLTILVLALTEKILSNNREENGLNTVSNKYETRSDNLLQSKQFVY